VKSTFPLEVKVAAWVEILNQFIAKVKTVKLKTSEMTNVFIQIINVIAGATFGEQVTYIISPKFSLI
jgi:hypothetical protein